MDGKRVIFLDYLRVIAIFMVLLVHSCEQFYFGPDGGFFVGTKSAAWWVVMVDSAVRAAVPLFVMASSYLLFPVTRPTGEFMRRRFLRVCVPFALWCGVYTWWNDGSFLSMLFNFPATTGGHLWFVPMLLGLYLLMPLLSPWAERVTRRELLGWIGVWAFTTTFPYLRLLWATLFADGWAHVFGISDFGKIPFLYGECAWNSFGTFHYVSGFIGYLLLGLYFRRFATASSRSPVDRASSPCAPTTPSTPVDRASSPCAPLLSSACCLLLWLAGMALVALPFLTRMANYGTAFPVSAPYAAAVDLEMSWEFCSTGVALIVLAYFLAIRRMTWSGTFYRLVIRPLSEASFGVYLMHMLLLVPICAAISPHLPVGATIFCTAALTFLSSSAIAYAIHRIPRLGKWLVG